MSVFDKKSSVGLREKYSQAIQTAKSLHMQGGAEERDGKLYFNGTVNSVEEKNQIWNALKTVPDWDKDVVADIKVKAARRRRFPTPCNLAIRSAGLQRNFWATPTTTRTSLTPTATSCLIRTRSSPGRC